MCFSLLVLKVAPVLMLQFTFFFTRTTVHGKVAAIKALLQIDDNDNEQVNVHQKQMLTLLDRQNRNVLHHLLDSVVPSDETFEAIRYIVNMIPSLLFQNDIRDKTPLQYVLERIMENDGTRRRHYMNSYGNDGEGIRKNYRMLKLLVECMERETRGWDDTTNVKVYTEQSLASVEGEETSAPTESNPRNVLQSACLLPKRTCPSELLAYLSSKDAMKLEGEVRDGIPKSSSINMAEEKNENGDLALHLLASNKSLRGSTKNILPVSGRKLLALRCEVYSITKAILDSYPSAISTPNSNNELPLRIAMRAGRRQTVAGLLLEYPEAVLLDEDMNDNKLFMHALSCISSPMIYTKDLRDGADERHLTTMFKLLTARPDIVSLAGTGAKSEKYENIQPKKKKWWKNLNPFS